MSANLSQILFLKSSRIFGSHFFLGSNHEFFVAQPQHFTPMQNLNLSFTVDQSCSFASDCYENGKRCDGSVDVTCLCKKGQCKKSGEKTLDKTH